MTTIDSIICRILMNIVASSPMQSVGFSCNELVQFMFNYKVIFSVAENRSVDFVYWRARSFASVHSAYAARISVLAW